MDPQLSQEVSLLRTLAANLKRVVIPTDPRVVELWRAQGVELPNTPPQTRTTIKPPGREALYKLAEGIADRVSGLARGAVFQCVQTELFGQLEAFVGRDPQSIKACDVKELLEYFESWFQAQAVPRQVYVPCVITPWPAPPFSIGPVSFVHGEDITKSDFYPRGPGSDALTRQNFDELIGLMHHTHANWLASIKVAGCDGERAQEVADLAIDLALVALQLAAPQLDTRGMCRLDARRGFVERRTFAEANGRMSWGIHRREPGLSIGEGTLQAVLKELRCW